jgi:hypothetical protein
LIGFPLLEANLSHLSGHPLRLRFIACDGSIPPDRLGLADGLKVPNLLLSSGKQSKVIGCLEPFERLLIFWAKRFEIFVLMLSIGRLTLILKAENDRTSFFLCLVGILMHGSVC